MKKLITGMFLLLSITIVAQERGAIGAELTDDELAELRAKRLAMQLDLNAEQEEKLKVLYANGIQSRRDLKTERVELKKDRMEINLEHKAALKEILSEEQYQKWEGLMEKRRKGLKSKRKN